MKKVTLLVSLVAAGMAFTSCEKYSTVQDANHYADCFTYAWDEETGDGFASEVSSVDVKGEIVNATFEVHMNNLQLFDGAPLKNVVLSNLIQYLKDKDENGNMLDEPLYALFEQESQTKTQGDLEIDNFRMGWLSTVFWMNFTADRRYKCWMLPRVYSLYADRNTIRGGSSTGHENGLNPQYRITFNAAKSTIDVHAVGVKYIRDQYDTSKTLDFRSMEWRDVPVEFYADHYEIELPAGDRIIPVINGREAPEYKITKMNGSIAISYEGEKKIELTMETPEAPIEVTSIFSYSNKDQK